MINNYRFLELILKPSKVLSPMIADGLLRAIRSNTNADVLSKLQELIDKLFSVLDVPIGNYYTDCWTESIFTGVFLVYYLIFHLLFEHVFFKKFQKHIFCKNRFFKFFKSYFKF